MSPKRYFPNGPAPHVPAKTHSRAVFSSQGLRNRASSLRIAKRGNGRGKRQSCCLVAVSARQRGYRPPQKSSSGIPRAGMMEAVSPHHLLCVCGCVCVCVCCCERVFVVGG